jgi:hypothetical protein
MNKFVLSCLFILTVCCFGQAQNGDYQFQFKLNNTLTKWVQAPDSSWFGIGYSVSFNDPGAHFAFIIKFDHKMDHIIWSNDTAFVSEGRISDISVLFDKNGGFYVGAILEDCDTESQDLIARFDSTGKRLWRKYTKKCCDPTRKAFLVLYPNDHVLFQTEAYTIELLPSGDFVYEVASNFSWNGIKQLDSSHYLLFGDHKVGKAGLLLLSVIPYSINDNIIDVIQLPSGDWLLLGKNTLSRMSSNFVLLHQKPILEVQNGSKFIKTDQGYWYTGKYIDGESLLRRIDTLSLLVTATFPQDKKYELINGFQAPGDTMIWLSGNTNFDLNKTFFLRSVPTSKPIINAVADIALTDIRMVQTPVSSYQENCNYERNYKFDIGAVYATVTNTGSIPIGSFKINGSYNSCRFLCPNFDEYTVAFNESLFPGESKEVLLFSQFQLYGEQFPDSANLCFWTSVPDDRLDAHPENDKFCKHIETMVATSESSDMQPRIHTSPNPAFEEIVFSVDQASDGDKPYSLEILDITGNVLVQCNFSSSQYRLERNNLPSGLYFYKIQQGGVVLGVGKVIFW